ncbi:hypothetical protein ACHAWF_014510 [Thalassiosira exigua]
MSDEFKHMREISYDLCRVVAAVLFGIPDNHFVGVPVTANDRFEMLQGRDIDLLMHGDTHTIEREIHERTTGAGFTFSSPIFYDGLAYFGNSAFVRCAEKEMKYDACSSLRLCAVDKTTRHEFVRSSFPSDFFTTEVSHEQMEEMLWNGTCNVIASDMSRLMLFASSIDEEQRGMYVLGKEMMTKEPLAIATRNSDREFSDIVNWIVQALFFGEEQGLVEDPRLCVVYRSSPTLISDLIFLNAVHCVGNYALTLTGTLLKIYGNGMLNCGVMSPDDSAYDNLVVEQLMSLLAQNFGGFHFSAPYYFGNETTVDPVSFFTLATREEDRMFSSVVNCVVLVTIYAAEKSVNDTRSGIVPLTSVFGNTLKFALRMQIQRKL